MFKKREPIELKPETIERRKWDRMEKEFAKLPAEEKKRINDLLRIERTKERRARKWMLAEQGLPSETSDEVLGFYELDSDDLEELPQFANPDKPKRSVTTRNTGKCSPKSFIGTMSDKNN